MTEVRLPEYAYIPGQNERHPETSFESLRKTASKEHNEAELARCDAFRAGLLFLHAGFYWEAHEVLEPVWMALPDKSAERQLVQGLIQLANGHLKLRMDRPKAALRLVGLARGLVPPITPANIMTLDMQDVHRWIDELESAIQG